MAEFDANTELTGKSKTSIPSSLFNRSFTMHGKPGDTGAKHSLNPSLNRTTSITKYYHPVQSMRQSLKGKVKDLCRLFEASRTPKSHSEGSESQLQSQHSKLKSPKTLLPDPKFSCYGNPSIRLPGTEDRIVVYLTSLRGIRRTFEDCYAVRMIFRGFRVWIDERDVSMDSAYRRELQNVLGEKNVTLPQVFIRGRYMGGADLIKSLFEIGELAKILEGFPVRQPGFVCPACGDVRFVPCTNCCGSKKVFDDIDETPKRCPMCNENGLIRCPDCGSC